VTRKCPKCGAESHAAPVAGKLSCRNCGKRWEDPEAGAATGELGHAFAEIRRLGARVVGLDLADDGGGAIALHARGVTVESSSRTDHGLIPVALAELEAALIALDRRPTK
jgi:hypothetical protein